MKIIIGSDHAGLDLKDYIQKHALEIFDNIEFEDVGTKDTQSVDYPDFADLVCKKIGPNEIGILICGSGQGMAMRANKYPHIRAALCWDLTTAKLSREHNNANVLCLGARLIPFGLAIEMVEMFLKTKFLGSRHENRVQKLSTPCK